MFITKECVVFQFNIWIMLCHPSDPVILNPKVFWHRKHGILLSLTNNTASCRHRKKGFARSTLLKELCTNVLANDCGLGKNCYIVATSFHIAVVLFSLFILTLFIIIFYRGQYL